MMLPDRKKAVTTILSHFGKKKMNEGGHVPKQKSLDSVSTSPDPDMDGYKAGMHAHMQEFMGAFKNNDHEAATEHMMNFLDAHKMRQETVDNEKPTDMAPEDKS